MASYRSDDTANQIKSRLTMDEVARHYAAVRAKAKTELRGYAAGYVTNALEGGHVQTPGRYVPAMGKKLKANRVKGKYMYRKTAAELPQIAERGAQEIEKKAMAYLEGKG